MRICYCAGGGHGVVAEFEKLALFQIASDSAVPAVSRNRFRLRYTMKIIPMDISVGGTMRIRIPLRKA